MELGHFGKEYAGEKAIISLTSWKARINTVGLTIFNLLKRCPGFHIVLTLSEEEFPKKEAELPSSLMTLVNNNLVELLWVYKNYKSFKKVLFTMDKYRDVPVISADDDCIYTYNYAEELYQSWVHQPNSVIACTVENGEAWGYATLHRPYELSAEKVLPLINIMIAENISDDDFLFSCWNRISHVPIIGLGLHPSQVCKFHDSIMPLGSERHRFNPKYKQIMEKYLTLVYLQKL